ncbi:MAG: sensor histidine kinase [Firmicutes bacterium]|nr:sensor histidine kinase [Bacillota bacterium]
MKELSLNILDITENSVKAGASLTSILLSEDDEELVLSIEDNGSGMSPEILRGVTDPFYTTRTTRKVGMGLPLLKLAAEQTGGSMSVESVSIDDDPENHGTKVKAVFFKNNIDFTPLGDVVSTITTLIQGHPDTDFYFKHEISTREKEVQVELDTREVREALDGVPLNEYEVISWIGDYLNEQYNGPDDTE